MLSKRFIFKGFYLIILLFTNIGCTDLEYYNESILDTIDGYINLELNYKITQSQFNTENNIKISDYRENQIKNAVLLIFEASNKDIQYDNDRLVQVSIQKFDQPTSDPFNFFVKPYSGNCRVKVIANLTDSILTIITNYKTLLESNSPTTIYEFKKLYLPFHDLSNSNNYLPLYADGNGVLPGINDKTNLTLEFKRMYARFDLEISPSVKIGRAHV